MVHQVLALKKQKKYDNLFENFALLEDFSLFKRNGLDLDPDPGDLLEK